MNTVPVWDSNLICGRGAFFWNSFYTS